VLSVRPVPELKRSKAVDAAGNGAGEGWNERWVNHSSPGGGKVRGKVTAGQRSGNEVNAYDL
jgi:hypothetical protein